MVFILYIKLYDVTFDNVFLFKFLLKYQINGKGNDNRKASIGEYPEKTLDKCLKRV